MPNPPLVLAPILYSSESKWDDYDDDCSGFVKAVCNDLGITLTGQANDIVDQIQRAPWLPLEDGKAAQDKANEGRFVLAGLKDTPNGHVAIITPGSLHRGRYPTGYWGKLHGVGRKNASISLAWTEDDLDDVIYAFRCIDVRSALLCI
jgi:hypothetical protein